MTEREKEMLEFIYARFCGIEKNDNVDYMVAFKKYIEKNSSGKLQKYENLYVEAKTKLDKQEKIYTNLHKEIDKLSKLNINLDRRINLYYAANTISDVGGIGCRNPKTRGDLLEEIIGLKDNLAECEMKYEKVNDALIKFGEKVEYSPEIIKDEVPAKMDLSLIKPSGGFSFECPCCHSSYRFEIGEVDEGNT